MNTTTMSTKELENLKALMFSPDVSNLILARILADASGLDIESYFDELHKNITENDIESYGGNFEVLIENIKEHVNGTMRSKVLEILDNKSKTIKSELELVLKQKNISTNNLSVSLKRSGQVIYLHINILGYSVEISYYPTKEITFEPNNSKIHSSNLEDLQAISGIIAISEYYINIISTPHLLSNLSKIFQETKNDIKSIPNLEFLRKTRADLKYTYNNVVKPHLKKVKHERWKKQAFDLIDKGHLEFELPRARLIGAGSKFFYVVKTFKRWRKTIDIEEYRMTQSGEMRYLGEKRIPIRDFIIRTNPYL